jgi:hypothetical protein
MGELRGEEPSSTTAHDRDASVASVLGELVEMFREYELPQWARALESDRLRVLSGDDEVYRVLRYRLLARGGLAEVRVGFGDRALNARLDELRSELASLIAEPEPDSAPASATPPDPTPAPYGERIEREPPPTGARVFFAADYPRGTLVHDDEGNFARSTWSVLDYDGRRRLRPLVRIWKYSLPVSIEEYRSLHRACIGWWITLGAMPALVVGTGIAGLRLDVWSILLVITAVLMPVAAVMVGVTERRRSRVVALYSEKTGMLVSPVSRGSRLHRAGPAATDDRAGERAASDRGAETDERMLRRLRGRRTSGATLTWVVFLSCDQQAGAEAMGSAAVRDGWELRYAGPQVSSTRWMIIAERDVTVLEPQEVRDARRYFEGLATTVDGGSYDGWQVDD